LLDSLLQEIEEFSYTQKKALHPYPHLMNDGKT